MSFLGTEEGMSEYVREFKLRHGQLWRVVFKILKCLKSECLSAGVLVLVNADVWKLENKHFPVVFHV